MKAKLIKTEVNYLLENKEGVIIASTSLNKEGKSLSKQNCDEIFGVYSPSELSKVLTEGERGAFEFGYCLAREHNKDKVFTLEDMLKAIQFGEDNTDIESFDDIPEEDKLQFIQSLQQPTEIEVEIEMETVNDGLDEMAQPQYIKVPKLDSEGCIILKKI